MTPEQIIRNIKLSIISDIKLEEPYFSIYNKIKSIINTLNIYESYDYYYEYVKLYGCSIDEMSFYVDYLHKRIYIDTIKTIDQFDYRYEGIYDFHYEYVIEQLIGYFIKEALLIEEKGEYSVEKTYLNGTPPRRISRETFRKVGKLDI